MNTPLYSYSQTQPQLFGVNPMNNDHDANCDNNELSHIHQQLCGYLIDRNMSNRQRRIRDRLQKNHRSRNTILKEPYVQSRTRTRIGGQSLLIGLVEAERMNVKRQHEAIIKDRDAYNGCDSSGLVNYVENSVLCTAEHKYWMVSELGAGAFSRVFRCQKMDDETQYAIKVTRNIKKYQLAAMNELTILKRIAANDIDNTSCCAHIIDCGLYFTHPMFVFPLLTQSLRSWMNTNIASHAPLFSFEQVIHLMWQMCRGVAFMHSLNIINADLKPDNLMLVSDEMDENQTKLKSTQIKIIDFGSAVMKNTADTKYHHLIQTRAYRAPEVILGVEWSFAADIWSLGCILVELICGKVLFPTRSDRNQLVRITQCIGRPPHHLLRIMDDKVGEICTDVNYRKYRKLSRYFVNNDNKPRAPLYDLCTKMLCWNPMERISANAALQHPVFNSQDRDLL